MNDQTIDSFKELLNEFCWSYQYPMYTIIKDGDMGYSINKLYIRRDYVTYKTDRWLLAPGVFDEFTEFYNFLQQRT